MVTARVVTNPRVEGVPIYLKAFDPDDPSANNDVVDDNLVGPDNRDDDHGDSAELGALQIVTGPDGTAATPFRVAHQPGDNHRVAATMKPTTQGQPTLDQLTDANVPPSDTNPATQDQVEFFIGTISQLLTVWRTLHVETDTMVRPTFAQNTFTMDWSEPREGPVPTQVLFEVDDPPAGGGHTEDDQFVAGFVELQDAAENNVITRVVVAYTSDENPIDDADFKDEVIMNIPDCGNGQSGLACLNGVTGGMATFSDDDISVEATFTAKTWGCDDIYAGPVASLAPPDLGALELRYHPAYIDPIQDLNASAVQGLVTFLPNQGFGRTSNYGKALWDQAKVARNLPVSTPNFWTVMVVSSWQEVEGKDYDPNSEIGSGNGVVLGINTHEDGSTSPPWLFLGSSYTGLCTVFKAVFTEAGMVGREQFTVAHEIGHTLGLPHNELPLDPNGNPIPVGLMDPFGNGQTLAITPANLQRLRDYNGP